MCRAPLVVPRFRWFLSSSAGHADSGSMASTPTMTRRTHRHAVLPAGQQQRAARPCCGRHLRDATEQSRNRGHAVRQANAGLRPWTMPERYYRSGATARQDDEDKLSVGLQRWPEDRRCASSKNPRHTRSCCGAWRSPYGVVLDGWPPIRRGPLTTSSCECATRNVRGNAKGHGRHVKQSGATAVAVCDMEVEPLPEGSGFEFVDKVVGGRYQKLHPERRKGRAGADGEGCRAAIRWSTSG